jgi:hypothetical protein
MFRVALTGGPGGGKSSLLQRVCQGAEISTKVAFAEEAIRQIGFLRIHPRQPEFQLAMVATQIGLETGMETALAFTPVRLLLFHRGTLDPCAFWQCFGNTRASFGPIPGL